MLLHISLIPGILLMLIQWRFSQLTGSMLVGCQGLLQLVLTILIFAVAFERARIAPARWYAWRTTVQLILGLVMLVSAGYVINESYVRWCEGAPLSSGDALPVVWLSIGGHWLLALALGRDMRRIWKDAWQNRSLRLLATCSLFTGLCLLVAHFTGWMWLDSLVAAGVAVVLGLLAAGFVLDAYWSMAEMEEA
jgi:divalent metal cation (Fe/Co/Zn/Cd) transporter